MRKCPTGLTCGQVCEAIFFIDHLCGKAQSFVGGTIPGWVVIECTGKLAEQAKKSKQALLASSTSLGILFLYTVYKVFPWVLQSLDKAL